MNVSDENRLWEAYMASGTTLDRNAVEYAYLWLIYDLARSADPAGTIQVDSEDLQAILTRALIAAIEAWKPGFGCHYRQYIQSRLKNALDSAIGKMQASKAPATRQ